METFEIEPSSDAKTLCDPLAERVFWAMNWICAGRGTATVAGTSAIINPIAGSA